jgi:hemoglobin
VTDWEAIGGEPAVSAIMDAFVDRMFDDMIVGFLFQGKDREGIKRHEVALVSSHMNGPLAYEGRPLVSLHRGLKINRGQFRRRIALLKLTLERFAVPPDVAARWIAFDERLIDSFTDGTDCVG